MESLVWASRASFACATRILPFFPLHFVTVLKLRNVLPVKFCARHTQPMTSHVRSWMHWRLQRCAWPLPSCVVARPEQCSSWETEQHAMRWVTLKKEPQLRIWLYPTWRIIKHGCGWKALKTIQVRTRHTVYSVKSNVASIDYWLISSHSYHIISCCILCSFYLCHFILLYSRLDWFIGWLIHKTQRIKGKSKG